MLVNKISKNRNVYSAIFSYVCAILSSVFVKYSVLITFGQAEISDQSLNAFSTHFVCSHSWRLSCCNLNWFFFPHISLLFWYHFFLINADLHVDQTLSSCLTRQFFVRIGSQTLYHLAHFLPAKQIFFFLFLSLFLIWLDNEKYDHRNMKQWDSNLYLWAISFYRWLLINVSQFQNIMKVLWNSERLNGSPGIVWECISLSFFLCWNIPNNEEKTLWH